MRKYLGPGILFAATAIGVSHLVQSTRAGANFGWSLWWIILLANVIKFPFFEFGSRFANATRTHLIDGYASQGRWALWMYGTATVLSMFTVTGAVSIVTAGLFAHLTQWQGSFALLTGAVFLLCFTWLAFGRFKFLNVSIQWITGILFLSTVLAFCLVVSADGWSFGNSAPPDWKEISNVSFTLALVGWMPTAVDLSVWNSIWTIRKSEDLPSAPQKRKVLAEFHLGYWLSAVAALLFLGLGAMLMYGDTSFPHSAVGFTGQLIELYMEALGSNYAIVIKIAATAAMFSTTLSVFDGYGRSLEALSIALFNRALPYWVAIAAVSLGGWYLVWEFQSRIAQLVDLAMLISFLIAPIVAILNHRLVHHSDFPTSHKPKRWLTVWSYAGIVTLLLMSIYFIAIQTFMQ